MTKLLLLHLFHHHHNLHACSPTHLTYTMAGEPTEEKVKTGIAHTLRAWGGTEDP